MDRNGGMNHEQQQPTSAQTFAYVAEEPRTGASFADAILDSLTANVALLDSSGIIIRTNAAWRRFADSNGCADRACCIGANYLVICEEAVRRDSDPTAAAALNGIRAVLRHEQDTFTLAYPCHSPSAKRWFRLRATRLSLEEPTGCVIAHEDITAEKIGEEAVREVEQALREVLELLPVGVWIVDRKGGILQCNRAGQRIWQGPLDDIRRRKGYRLDTGEPIANEERALLQANRPSEASIDREIRIECRDGTGKVLISSMIPRFDAELGIAGAIIVDQDITALKRQEQELLQTRANLEVANRELRESLEREQLLARTDGLTGVINRRHFLDMAEHECAVARRYGLPLSVVLFDIDTFKRINDSLGHLVGDEILRGVARRAGEQLRSADVLARYGGEEFIVMVPESAARRAEIVAERIRKSIAEQGFQTTAGKVAVTVSAGVSEMRSNSDTLEELIRRADRALYEAKHKGRNCTVVIPGIEPTPVRA
jgi:diguanylate cyclase (GGDEF)-like protein/PAS domain S-box-containing protein